MEDHPTQPHKYLLSKKWRFRSVSEHFGGGFVYARDGIYGWFDEGNAIAIQLRINDGKYKFQYPLEVKPDTTLDLSDALSEAPSGEL